METLFRSYQRLLNVLLLCGLVLALSRMCQADPTNLKSECLLARAKVNVTYPGCEPTVTTVPICNGACLSSVTAIAEPPFLKSHCNSCRASTYKTKPRRLNFVCNGVVKEHRVYFSEATACGCIDCSSGLNK